MCSWSAAGEPWAVHTQDMCPHPAWSYRGHPQGCSGCTGLQELTSFFPLIFFSQRAWRFCLSREGYRQTSNLTVEFGFLMRRRKSNLTTTWAPRLPPGWERWCRDLTVLHLTRSRMWVMTGGKMPFEWSLTILIKKKTQSSVVQCLLPR